MFAHYSILCDPLKGSETLVSGEGNRIWRKGAQQHRNLIQNSKNGNKNNTENNNNILTIRKKMNSETSKPHQERAPGEGHGMSALPPSGATQGFHRAGPLRAV